MSRKDDPVGFWIEVWLALFGTAVLIAMYGALIAIAIEYVSK